MLKVLLLHPHSEKPTGNQTTAKRISKYIESFGWHCTLQSMSHFSDSKDLSLRCKADEIKLIISIHALHSSRCLPFGADVRIPYVLIFGGTDVNDAFTDKEKLSQMTGVVSQAAHLIAFNQSMARRALELWGSTASEKLTVIPQSVELSVSPSFCLPRYLEQHAVHLGKPFRGKIILLVAGIRPIKDPIYVTQAFSDWRYQNNVSDCILVILGPILDRQYGQQFLDHIHNLNGVYWLTEVSSNEAQAAIKQSFCLVNSSINEGMSATILEAMQLGVPVICRANPGNQSLVVHSQTGLLYDSPSEFINCLEKILENPSFKDTLVRNAQLYVHRNHSEQQECSSYQKVLKSVLNTSD